MKKNNDKFRDTAISKFINVGYIPIANAEELNNIRDEKSNTFGKGTQWEGLYRAGLDKDYLQVSDIYMDEFLSDKVFEPIGTYGGKSFTGKYCGGNFIIKGLEIVRPKKFGVGLFGSVMKAKLFDISINTDKKIHGCNYVGGLVGISDVSDIDNCSIIVKEIVGKRAIGGIVGEIHDTMINNSESSTNIKSFIASYIGGISGASHSSVVTNSTAVVSINCKGSNNVGGIVGGAIGSTILNSYSFYEIKGNSNVGGIAGISADTEIENCLIKSKIEGNENVGGIVGHVNNGKIMTTLCKGEVISAGTKGDMIGNGACIIMDSYSL